MTFPQVTTKVPTSISTIQVIMADSTEIDIHEEPIGQSIRFFLDVLDQNGKKLKTLEGNLAPYLTPGEITALENFMSDLRIQAETQILP